MYDGMHHWQWQNVKIVWGSVLNIHETGFSRWAKTRESIICFENAVMLLGDKYLLQVNVRCSLRKQQIWMQHHRWPPVGNYWRICDTFSYIKPGAGCIRTSGVKENTWCTSLEGSITSSFLSLHFRLVREVLLFSPPHLAFYLDRFLSGLHYTGCPSLKLRLLWTRTQSFFRSTLNLRQPRSSSFVCLAGFALSRPADVFRVGMEHLTPRVPEQEGCLRPQRGCQSQKWEIFHSWRDRLGEWKCFLLRLICVGCFLKMWAVSVWPTFNGKR